jgi:hypothetical protein
MNLLPKLGPFMLGDMARVLANFYPRITQQLVFIFGARPTPLGMI